MFLDFGNQMGSEPHHTYTIAGLRESAQDGVGSSPSSWLCLPHHLREKTALQRACALRTKRLAQ
jgi:hypothetical protein